MLWNLQILIILIRRVKKHPISADESFRDGRTKKSSTLAGGKHKNRCLCNIPFKSDDKGEPRKNTSFGFFFNFLPLIILEREGLYLSSYVMFQYSLYTIRRVKKHQISADESYRDGLTKKSQVTFVRVSSQKYIYYDWRHWELLNT